MAKVAKGRLTWTQSVSSRVLSQNLVVTVDGISIVDRSLESTVSEFPLVLKELSHADVSLVAVNSVGSSVPAILSIDIPELSSPESPTLLNFVIDEIVDEV